MNTIQPTPIEAASAAPATSTLPPPPAPAAVPARFSAPVRATTGEPWPGTREWNDHDYRQFVDLVSQGAFPDIEDDPCAWDDFFVRDRESETPFRPMLISPEDYRDHMTFYREYYGLLAWKLWDVARSKGFAADYEAELLREMEEIEQREEEERRLAMRGEVDALKQNMPVPPRVKPLTPLQQWHEQVMANLPPEAPLVERVKLVQAEVMEGQPFRNAVHQESDPAILDNTFGPLMLDESTDALADPFELEEPEPVLRKWGPDATTEQILNGSARDLSNLISVLIARQNVAVGYAPDDNTINQTIRLSRTLCNLTRAIHTTELTIQAKKRGRPRKERLPK